jgi:hypothetical protein
MARPPKWAEKIQAPEDAMEFYRLIQKLQTSTAFRECHPFSGATINHVPYISWENSTTALPKVLLGFLGIPYRQQICKTHGCANPFHYVDVGLQTPTLKGLKGPTSSPHRPDSTEAYIELIEYEVDKAGVDLNFESVRPLIPVEDISDELLNLAIAKMSDSSQQRK